MNDFLIFSTLALTAWMLVTDAHVWTIGPTGIVGPASPTDHGRDGSVLPHQIEYRVRCFNGQQGLVDADRFLEQNWATAGVYPCYEDADHRVHLKSPTGPILHHHPAE